MTNCEHDFRGLLGICDKCKKTNIIIAFEDGFEKGKAEQKFSETEEGKKVIKQICIDWGLLYKRQDSETMWKDFDVARVIRETADLAHEKGKDSEREEHDCKITEDIKKAYVNGRNDEETEWRTILLAEREKGLIDKGIKIGKAEQDKLMYCPVCRKIVIWSEVLKDVENGGMGMCDCEWSCNNRIYMEYLPVTKEFIQNIKAEACHMHSEEHFYGCPDKECHEWMEKVVKDIEKTERNRILDEIIKREINQYCLKCGQISLHNEIMAQRIHIHLCKDCRIKEFEKLRGEKK